MPIYEYRCKQGHTFEVMQRITDDPVASCQTCDAPVQRVFHPVAVHFKGSGFYNTDYGTRKRSRDGGDDGASGGESKATPDPKPSSDSKPEKKPSAPASATGSSAD